MRVYLNPPQPSRGLQRIADALQRYAPSTIEVVDDPARAQLTVIYAIGRRQHIERQVAEILGRGDKYAVIQVCLRSTMSPHTAHWMKLWHKAVTVWSYYDLEQAVVDDCGKHVDDLTRGDFRTLVNFIHAPLGVDSSVFKFYEGRDNEYAHGGNGYVILTSGLSRLQESVRECEIASDIVGRHMFHLGRRVSGRPHVTCAEGMSDLELAKVYSTCEFVSGLRRTEGFELPAAEGLLCGARPILFDSADYRFNYKDWGLYIREGSRREVVDQLVDIFKQGAEPVTTHEREEACHWFNWERVCGEFWQRCLQ